MLNEPRAAIADPLGNLVVTDTLNQRLRSSTLPTLAFTSQQAGIASSAQAITLSNSGGGALTIASLGFAGAFGPATGGTCPAMPIQLAAGASCTQNIAYLPLAAGTASGSVSVSGPGIVPQTILLSGSAATAAAAIALTASSTTAFAGQPVTFNVTVTTANSFIATGTVTFYDGSAQIGSVQTLANNAAAITVTTLALGTHSITAVYSGDTNFAGSTSAAITELIANADFTIAPNPSSPSGSTTQTVAPGQPAQYALMIQPIAGPLSYPVILSATGLPPGATVSFNPQTITVGASAVNFTMTIQTAAVSAAMAHGYRFASAAAMGLLLLPFAGSIRRRAKYLRAFVMAALVLACGAALTSLSGCGSGSGFFGKPQATYTIQVIGTTTGPGAATIQHLTSVQLSVE
jgi:hypothetical protein